MGEHVSRRFLVAGRVQGVWFRAGAREQAQRLQLDGHARNLDDGRVEVLARGPADAVETLAGWLWQGPAGARVGHVEEVPVDHDPRPGFRIL